MATAKKRNSSGPGRKPTKRTTRTTKKNTTDTAGSGLQTEIILCVILAVSILLFISNFGIGGVVGNAISMFFFGLFGIMAYIFPILLFIGAAFFVANSKNPLVVRKMVGVGLCFLFLCALMQLLMYGYTKGTPVTEYYLISAEDKLGGGLFGGLLVLLFAFAFGIVGAYVLTVIGLIIGAIVLTQRPLLSQFQERSVSAVRKAHSQRAALRQERENNGELPKRGIKFRQMSLPDLKADTEEGMDIANTSKEQGGKNQANPDFLIDRGDMPIMPDFTIEPAIDVSIDPSIDSVMEPGMVSGTNAGIRTGMDSAINPAGQSTMSGESSTAGAGISIEPTPGVLPTLNPVDGVGGMAAAADSSEAGADPADPTQEKRNLRNPRSSQEEIEENINHIRAEIGDTAPKPKPQFKFPPLTLLKPGKRGRGDTDQHLRETAAKLQQTLHNFGVNVTVTNASCGPTVTRYELQPEQGVKVSKIVSLTDDIKLNLAASDIRIEAPIPGKAAVGIEVPNAENTAVMLRELLQSDTFIKTTAALPFAVGKDIAGKVVVSDIAKMPHLLIAGATGSGKSVCINTLIMSLLYKCHPDEVKVIMIDPKVVELSVYNGIPHLMIPVVTDPKKAAGALNWAVAEMTERYNLFAEFNVRDLKSYNEKVEQMQQDPDIPEDQKPQKRPKIVIIVDELADLMMVAPGEVEDAICRLAQLARAAGLHLIIATQRPSVNVITGLIKANMPSRIAFAVSSGVDSRVVLDMNGAEKLLGKGDMLFYPQGYPKPARLQGAFVSDDEVGKVVKFLSSQQGEVVYNTEVEDKINSNGAGQGIVGAKPADDKDLYFAEAGKFIIEKDKASIGMLQRMFKIGFNRAARIMDQLADAGVVGEEEGTKPRKVLMSMEQFEQVLEEIG